MAAHPAWEKVEVHGRRPWSLALASTCPRACAQPAVREMSGDDRRRGGTAAPAATMERLRGSGFREGSQRIQLQRLRRLGFRWLISEEELPAIGEPVERCGSVVVYGLGSE